MRIRPFFVLFVLTSATGSALYACAGSSSQSGFEELDASNVDGASTSGFLPKADAAPTGCKGIACNVVDCGGGTKTTLSGTVYAPTPAQFGKPDPIYNAILYVPNGDLQPFPEGVSCDKCGTITSGAPIVTALSGADGKFSLANVPAGDNVPIVIQVGRWRRLVKLPHVEACKDNVLTAEQTRLPRNKAEGDIPLMAVATSPYDPTECILRKIGIDAEEFTVPTKPGRVHLYKGGGATLTGDSPPPASSLWASAQNLKRYDIVAFPCQTDGAMKPDTAGRANLLSYADEGGRAFVTDLSKDMIEQGPPGWKATGTFGGSYANPALIDTTFPKGAALAEWLQVIGATPTKGQIALQNVVTSLSVVNAPAQRWVYGGSTQTYSFNTPVGVDGDAQCGRVVYSGFHIANPGGSAFPGECNTSPLTPQEKALEFLLFDLAACIQKDDTTPVPPVPVK